MLRCSAASERGSGGADCRRAVDRPRSRRSDSLRGFGPCACTSTSWTGGSHRGRCVSMPVYGGCRGPRKDHRGSVGGKLPGDPPVSHRPTGPGSTPPSLRPCPARPTGQGLSGADRTGSSSPGQVPTSVSRLNNTALRQQDPPTTALVRRVSISVAGRPSILCPCPAGQGAVLGDAACCPVCSCLRSPG
jgi:hypothetical protein